MIQQICTFFLDGAYFGIEIEEVQEIIRQQSLTQIPLAPADICGLMNLRGQIIPVVDLPCRLGLRSAACEVEKGLTHNVIVNAFDDVVSFVVDQIGDVIECSSDDFELPPAHLNCQIRSFLKGAYKLEQGFLLLLNTEKLLDPALHLS